MIREFTAADVETARSVYLASGLPESCFPDHEDPLFIIAAVLEVNGAAAMMSFLKVTSEVYLLVDRNVGTPEQRWERLKELTAYMRQEAWKKGLNEMSCWVPPEIEKAFGRRLLELGFAKSPWQSYTLPLIGLNDSGGQQ